MPLCLHSFSREVEIARQIRRVTATIVIFSALVACQEQREPTAANSMAPKGLAQAALEWTDFKVDGTPARLLRDRSRLIVETSEASALDGLMTVLMRNGRVIARVSSPGVGLRELRLTEGQTSSDTVMLDQLKTLKGVEFASYAYKTTDGRAELTPRNSMGVQFKASVSHREILDYAKVTGLSVLRPARPDSARYWWTFALPHVAWNDPVAYTSVLEKSALVEWAAVDLQGGMTASTPNDPFYGLQFQMLNSYLFPNNGVAVDINIEPARAISTGSGVRVAVIDAGVQQDHPDFGGRVLQGYDVWSNNSCTVVFSDFRSDCAWHPATQNDHGTNVAGILGASASNGIGIAGVAPGATLIPVRLWRRWLAQQVDSFPSDEQMGAAIDWAWQVGAADVLNNSWGATSPSYPGNNFVTSAIQRARANGRAGKGSVVVFSTGNQSNRSGSPPIMAQVPWPGRLNYVLGVTAMNRYGMVSNYSNQGLEIDVSGPSSGDLLPCGSTLTSDGVVTTSLTYGGCQDGGAGYTNTFGGTSAAVPLASGVAALLLARWPQLNEVDVRTRIAATSDAWGASSTFGAGKLNAGRALSASWPSPIASILGPNPVRPNQICSWSGAVVNGVQPYAYEWRVNGVPRSTDPLFEWTTGSSSFTLQLRVTDQMGMIGVATITINVSMTAPSWFACT